MELTAVKPQNSDKPNYLGHQEENLTDLSYLKKKSVPGYFERKWVRIWVNLHIAFWLSVLMVH